MASGPPGQLVKGPYWIVPLALPWFLVRHTASSLCVETPVGVQQLIIMAKCLTKCSLISITMGGKPVRKGWLLLAICLFYLYKVDPVGYVGIYFTLMIASY